MIATGSRPYRPPDVDFTHPRIFDSDTILDLSFTPQSITIYGAGVVGCEYTSIFRNLDVKVNLVNTRGKLLEFLDDEIIDALSYHLRDQGVLIRHNETYQRVEPLDDGVVLHLKSGKQLKTDVLLWANGRTGNTDDMGLETLGIKVNSRGQIEVNENLQTAVPHIYAVGDVIGPPALASAAYDQGRFAATHLLTGRGERALIKDIPTGIYTSPEISSLGRTERELTADKVPYEIGHAHVQEPGPRADHRPDGRHAQDPVPPRDAGDAGHSLLRRQRLGDHPHRPGDHVAQGRGQHAACTSSTRRSTIPRWPRPTASPPSTATTGCFDAAMDFAVTVCKINFTANVYKTEDHEAAYPFRRQIPESWSQRNGKSC